MKKIKKIKELIIENGGLTLSSNGEVANLKSGYMVSMFGYEKVIKIEDLKLQDINNYLLIAKRLGAYVGFWVDDGKIYLDISKNIKNRIEALKIAKINRQLAIYDLKEEMTIYL